MCWMFQISVQYIQQQHAHRYSHTHEYDYICTHDKDYTRYSDNMHILANIFSMLWKWKIISTSGTLRNNLKALCLNKLAIALCFFFFSLFIFIFILLYLLFIFPNYRLYIGFVAIYATLIVVAAVAVYSFCLFCYCYYSSVCLFFIIIPDI